MRRSIGIFSEVDSGASDARRACADEPRTDAHTARAQTCTGRLHRRIHGTRADVHWQAAPTHTRHARRRLACIGKNTCAHGGAHGRADADRSAELSDADKSFAHRRVAGDPPRSSPRRRAASTRIRHAMHAAAPCYGWLARQMQINLSQIVV